MQSIDYQVYFEQRQQHIFVVKLHIPAGLGQELILSLPNWLPGSYLIRDFAKHIIQFTVPEQCSLISIDKSSWRLTTQNQACTLVYEVYAFDTSVRTAYLDQQRAFFNGSSLFLKVTSTNTSALAYCLELVAPENCPQWRVATGLPRAQNTAIYAFGQYFAKDYAQLIDCPVEIGEFDSFCFQVYGMNHYLVITGQHYADIAILTQHIQPLCEHHMRLFSPQQPDAPFTEYWFLTHLLPNQYGGLEHKNSTALLCSLENLQHHKIDGYFSDDYKQWLSLVAHEYFHAWNVCRIKPEEFQQLSYQTEVYTTQLWAYEGITSYYDDFTLYRAGLIKFEEYLALLEKTYSRVVRGQGQHKQAVATSSFYAWTKFYQQDESAVNHIVSYYTKGALVALWLDLTLRTQTKGQYSLDDVMRHLWQNYLNQGQGYAGTKEQDFFVLLDQLTQQSFSPVLQQLLHQAQPIDLSTLLAKVGVELNQYSAKVEDLLVRDEQQQYSLYVGIQCKTHTHGLVIQQVLEHSPAEQAGLSAKDIIIAINHQQANLSLYQFICQHTKPNKPILLHVFRDQQLLVLTVHPCQPPQQLVKLTVTHDEMIQLWNRLI